jgi:catalase-peroxidase
MLKKGDVPMLKKSIPLAVVITIALSSGAAFADADAKSPKFWWPDQLNLSPLRQNTAESNPMAANFNYAAEFKTLDLEAVKKDIKQVMRTSQDWWPADYGNYGPFFVRMAWHSAGVYRVFDGRGGADGAQQRFDPLNSWPDNVSLDKARRLLWPIKQKYGSKISWGDLMVLTGTISMESMGFKTFGFGGGRIDEYEPEMVNWGKEKEFLSDKMRYHGDRKLDKPLAAVQMGLIYVNPEGPGGVPDPLLAAEDIRTTFGRMAMNDEETVALIAGGHTFGKAHGAHGPEKCVGAEPTAAGVEEQGLGWKNTCGKGNAEDTVSSGLEGAWTISPTAWSINYLQNLINFEWVKTKSPAGAILWTPKNADELQFVPDAHIAGKTHAPIMFTTDIALKADPKYRKIAERFLDNSEAFDLAFAKAWFKLTHRDMGPQTYLLGPDVPAAQLWQDPIPAVDYQLVDAKDVKNLKVTIVDSGLTVPQLVRTAWGAAASFRDTDHRGGANGARIRLAPQKNWPANSPEELSKVLNVLQGIQADFNAKSGNKKVSLADIIVLGGAAAVEKAANDAGNKVNVPFTAGRADTTQELTDVNSFAVLEPTADGFRNYFSLENTQSPAQMMVEKANLLSLSVPEMTVLVGGMRALNANAEGISHGVLTSKPGTLTNDFFVNLLDMSTKWEKSSKEAGVYQGLDRKTGKLRWTATSVDLIFGSNNELRAVAEVYASVDSTQKFVNDFADAWVKVMTLDRFDLHH